MEKLQNEVDEKQEVYDTLCENFERVQKQIDTIFLETTRLEEENIKMQLEKTEIIEELKMLDGDMHNLKTDIETKQLLNQDMIGRLDVLDRDAALADELAANLARRDAVKHQIS